MARRTFIKAYGDIVGGVGNDVSVSMGHEVSKKPSTMKLTSKDVSHGMRRAVEIRPVEDRQMPNCSLQAAHSQRRNGPIQEEVGKTNFVNIDGDGGKAAKGNAQNNKAIPQTAYKTRSFMSSVDLGPSGKSQKPKTTNQHNPDAPPPSWSPEKPKVPEEVRMFLPKGIDSKDKPYVAPKFMPSYRDMMAPKPKPDPLVSIVETTPPSMQKWAIEWNTEPKPISISELREDIIRETAEKSRAPPENVPRGPSTSRTSSCFQANEAKQVGKPSYIPEHTKVSGHTTTETAGKNQANASDKGQSEPWSNLQIPTEYDPRGPNNPNDKRKLGKPLIDWVPPRFITTNHLQNDEYSFKEAIAQGMPAKANTPNANDISKLSILKSKENSVNFDTEEQRFHKWFKERMAAAVQSVVDNQPTKPGNNQLTYQPVKSGNNNHPVKSYNNNQAIKSGNNRGTGQDNNQPAVKGISKLEHSANLNNPNGQSQIIEAEENATNSGMKESFTTSIGMTPPVARSYPIVSKKASNVSHEPESGSSFCHWLKLRGHPIVKKEPDPPESIGSSEKIDSNIPQNKTKFPWSLSYTLRRKTSSRAAPKRLASAKNISKSHKSISQNSVGQPNKPNITDFVNPQTPKSLKRAGKTFHKAYSNRSLRGPVKKSVRSETKVSVGRSMNKIPKTDFPRQAASIENLYPGLFGDGWNIDSEVDHVNKMRRTEMATGPSKATSSKKLFPTMAGPQMKYWESKYGHKPKSAQAPSHSTPRTPGSRNKTAHNWYRSKKSPEGVKSIFNDSLAAKHVENDSFSFSSIDEVSVPFKFNGNQFKDQIMEFSDDFDVDGFLCKEESTEKQLLDVTHKQSDRAPDVKPQGVERSEDASRKLPVKESIKFKRSAQVHPKGTSGTDTALRQRLQQKIDDDDLVMAFGEDPGLEDLEWSEFIGPRNGLDGDADLTRILALQAHQISSEQNSRL